ncbi:hypothetical protein PENTCL1PPCAC_9780, partial [Pristionchus entomophagus]
RVAEMSSELEESNRRTENAVAANSEISSKLEEMTEKEKRIIRISREYEMRAEYAENHFGKKLLDAQHSCEDQLWTKNEELSKMKIDLEIKEGTIRQLNNTIVALNKKLKESDDDLKMKNHEVSIVKMDLDAKEEEKRKYTRRIHQLTGTNEKLNYKLDDLKWDLEKMGEKTRNLIEGNKKLNMTVSNLKKRLMDVDSIEDELWMKNDQ